MHLSRHARALSFIRLVVIAAINRNVIDLDEDLLVTEPVLKDHPVQDLISSEERLCQLVQILRVDAPGLVDASDQLHSLFATVDRSATRTLS